MWWQQDFIDQYKFIEGPGPGGPYNVGGPAWGGL